MKVTKYIIGLMIISWIAISAGSAFAWETCWQFKQAPSSNVSSSGTTPIEMQKKYDSNSMDRFQGTMDSSSGYTVMRNLNGGTMRGYINHDGSGLLRDQNGNFHRVNTRR